MKHTKENIIKLLNAMEDEIDDCVDRAETEKDRIIYAQQSYALNQIICILTNEEYFKQVCKQFNLE